MLRALGDPTRLRLLRLLSTEPRSPQSLAVELKLSLPTVSHHMRELRVAGLVRIESLLLDKKTGRPLPFVKWMFTGSVQKDGKYLPLTPELAKAQLQKLEAAAR